MCSRFFGCRLFAFDWRLRNTGIPAWKQGLPNARILLLKKLPHLWRFWPGTETHWGQTACPSFQTVLCLLHQTNWHDVSIQLCIWLSFSSCFVSLPWVQLAGFLRRFKRLWGADWSAIWLHWFPKVKPTLYRPTWSKRKVTVRLRCANQNLHSEPCAVQSIQSLRSPWILKGTWTCLLDWAWTILIRLFQELTK